MAVARKTAILDAAEELFALHGLNGASMRNIAGKADVDVSLITYHFKTKDKLFASVIERRTSVFNREQMFHLEECERKAAPDAPGVEDVVDAFSYVFLKRAIAGDRQWRNFFHLFTRLSNDPGRGAEIMARYFDPIARRTIESMCPSSKRSWGCRSSVHHIIRGAVLELITGIRSLRFFAPVPSRIIICIPAFSFSMASRTVIDS